MTRAVLVNIVSQIPESIWRRELPAGVEQEYVHTREPVEADVHVIYGLRTRLEIPAGSSNTFFVASEPPEIRKYDLNVLRRYSRVLAPNFSYLHELQNFLKVSAIAPWWVGTRAGGSEHYDDQVINISLTREQLASPWYPDRNVLSVIVSSKARTALQQQRRRLVDYLERKMTQIEIWGEGRRFAEDKADVLRLSRYHLAIENSRHPGYWTEKLSDPILLSNFVFYQGAPDVGATFDTRAIEEINCFDLDGTYRTISDTLASDSWASTLRARDHNRNALLARHSFHRVLDQLVSRAPASRVGTRKTVIPAQHPVTLWKRLVDPLYRIGAREIKFRLQVDR